MESARGHVGGSQTLPTASSPDNASHVSVSLTAAINFVGRINLSLLPIYTLQLHLSLFLTGIIGGVFYMA